MDDPFAESREAARRTAANTLCGRGFVEQGDGSFLGKLTKGDQGISVRVELPKKFPDVPPAISLRETRGVTRRSHIEPKGKLCLFPPTGVLVDASRPERVVADSLERASHILFEEEEDYRDEFLAYWRQPYTPELLNAATELDTARPLAVAETARGYLVVGDTPGHQQEWLRRVGWQATGSRNAYVVPLSGLPDAPPFDSMSTHGDLFAILNRHAEIDDCRAFETWLKEVGLPAFLLLSAPGTRGPTRVLLAAELKRADGTAATRLHKGFRPGMMPPALEVARSKDQPAIRIAPLRADHEHVVARVGGDVQLKESSVAVIGCGSLGSQIAVNLAASGVGRITLIDKEFLSADNIHRHPLGMSSVGEPKTHALRNHLLARFPHLAIRAAAQDVETLFASEQGMLTAHSLIVLATGDEALELRFNALFDRSVRRIHAWLEPIGVGGHALLTGETMCYGCLFDRDELGIYNLASLVRRGQDFLRTIDGCSGTFTPFGFIDAAQGAIEAARLAVEVLRDEAAPPRLVSWLGNPRAFQAEGHELSSRGVSTLEKGRVVEHAYGRRECEVCCGG